MLGDGEAKKQFGFRCVLIPFLYESWNTARKTTPLLPILECHPKNLRDIFICSKTLPRIAANCFL